jgi:hypothetical protein
MSPIPSCDGSLQGIDMFRMQTPLSTAHAKKAEPYKANWKAALEVRDLYRRRA